MEDRRYLCGKRERVFPPGWLSADLGRLRHWLGNVWRFPYITGKYGGAAFVLVYLLFLVIMGLPVMVMEFSVGRAAKQGIGLAFRKLEPRGRSGICTATGASSAVTC